jgi:UDP-GlcNAc:undecaprenyl-phosphate GlcNAc-1-phosphate transferase
VIKELLVFFVTLLLAAAVLPRLAGIASRVGLVDMPNKRKAHVRPRPLVGGIGMAIALSVSCIAFVPLSNLRGFYAGFILLVIVGFLDDFKEMRYGGKFIAQILAVLSMVYFSGLSLDTFGNLLGFGPIEFGALAVPATVFCIVGVINAFNMVDGLDGLAGGVSFVAFSSFAVLAYLNGQEALTLLALGFSGATLAFLYFNRLPARLFMGDAGSLSIGFALGFFAIAVTQKQGSVVAPVTALLVLAAPICDTIRVIIARLLRGRSPFVADSKHLHHLLIRMGFNRKRTVSIIVAISTLLSLAAIAGTMTALPDYYLFAGFTVYAAVYTAIALLIKRILTAKFRLRKRLPGYASRNRLMNIVYLFSSSTRILRRERRVPIKTSVTCRLKGEAFLGTMIDLSLTGFSAVFHNAFSIGDRTECEILLAGLPARVNLTAEIIWSRQAHDVIRYGFRTVKISEAELEFLKVYLRNPDIQAAWGG